jgi:hypothetical protein
LLIYKYFDLKADVIVISFFNFLFVNVFDLLKGITIIDKMIYLLCKIYMQFYDEVSITIES